MKLIICKTKFGDKSTILNIIDKRTSYCDNSRLESLKDYSLLSLSNVNICITIQE